MPNQCGKSCENCAVREEIHCGGCQYILDCQGCEIAECASKNNHETCETCILRQTCPTKRNAFSMHKIRAEKAAAAISEQTWLSKNAPVLANWLRNLFLLMIVDLIVGLFTGDAVAQIAPNVPVSVPDIILFVLDLVQVYCIWQLRDVHTNYRTASLFRLISTVLTVAADIASGFMGEAFSETAASVVTLIINLPGTVITIYALYLLFTAHSWVTAGADNKLSETWSKLWKWQIGCLLGVLCSPLLALFGVIGALALLVCVIGMLVVGILELFYLKRTANLFRYIADSN